MRRVNVVGTSSSGKRTLAIALAERLSFPYIELDALHWGPNWAEAPNEVMRERVRSAIGGETWVVDGNYSAVRDLVWARADTVVWLDLPLPTILARYARRTVRRLATRQQLWSGNRERLWFLSAAIRCCGGSWARTAVAVASIRPSLRPDRRYRHPAAVSAEARNWLATFRGRTA